MNQTTAQNIAKKLMDVIFYDNGYNHGGNKQTYPEPFLTKIASAVEPILNKQPELFSDSNIELLGAGDRDEAAKIFNTAAGLEEALTDYFDNCPLKYD